MFCSISGTVPEQAVVSTKSGLVFEKRLVEKYVREKGTCPITGEPLTQEDLLTVKSNKTVKPRTAPATSIPGLLNMFHDEWDAVMLEMHSLRQHLHTTRQELCHALYQQDAAVRVIARLMRERDDARGALESARSVIQAEAAAQKAADEEQQGAAKRAKVPQIPDAVLQELTEVNAQLSKGRKQKMKEVPATQATPDVLASLTLAASVPLHKTTQGGITAIETQPGNPAVVATAGVDGTIQVFDCDAQRQLATLEGHSKRLTGLQYVSDSVLISSSADKTVRIWRQEDSGAFGCSAVLQEHTGEVVGVTLHPCRKYAVTASSDATWCFWDLATAACLKQVSDEAMREAYTAVQFHPDGLILGTATEANAVRIWEVKAQKNVATLGDHTAPVKGLVFSENGYHLATAADDGVRVWDLRKLKVLKTIAPEGGLGFSCVAFDAFGQYLAMGSGDVRVCAAKQDWAVVKTLADMPKKGVLSLRWGTDARSLLVGAADHNLRVFKAEA